MIILRWLVLIILGLAIYAQTFGYNFVFDDNFYILDTPYIRSFDTINQIWATLPKTRLVGVYSFALNYHICHLDPRGYHIFNFLIHLLAAGLVWALAALLFKITTPGPWEELSYFIALLFLVHPCQTQAVSYISQRFESMAAVFYLGSIYSYVRARISRSTAHKILLFTCSTGLAILGIFTKETAVTIPLMVLAVELILFKSLSRRRYFLIIILGGIFAVLFMKTVRTNFVDAYFHFSAPSESYDGDIITGGKYVLTQMRVFLTFLRLFILPVNQNLDYDYPLSTGLLDPPLTLAGLCSIGFIIFLIFKLRQKWPLIAFGLAWVLIIFSVNTVPRVNVIFEHKLYLISFGFFLAAVCGLSAIIKDRKILFGFLIMLITVLSLVSYKRNQVWKNEGTLWSDVVVKAPHKSRAYNGLGVFLGKQGKFFQALYDFNRAIEINPDYAVGYNNRGNTYLKLGSYTQAGSDLNKAIAIKPDYAEAYANRGDIYEAQGNFTQALSDYNKAIAINHNDVDAYYKRGIFYDKQDNFTRALLDYDKIIEINPDIAEVYYDRGLTYFLLKDYDRAWLDVHKIRELGSVIDPGFLEKLKEFSGRNE